MHYIVGFCILITTINYSYALEAFDDQLIKSPKMGSPKRGSLKGEFSAMGDSAIQHKTGSFGLQLPISFPSLRGQMIFPVKFSYSPGFGMSAMGMGISYEFKAERVRRKGLIQYNHKDLISSPWGLFVPSTELGVWYKRGGGSLDKMVLSESNNELIVFFSDGRKAVFLARDTLQSSKGVHSWYLSIAYDKNKNQTKYVYEKNESKKIYLKEIYYGGHQLNYQYKVSFDYAIRKSPYSSYITGKKIIDDRVLKKINIYHKISQFQLKSAYKIRYHQSSLTPAFFLKSIQKEYVSGKNDPIVTFEYDRPMDYIGSLKWKRFMGAEHILEEYRDSTFTHKLFNFIDFNNDGIDDIESFRANDFTNKYGRRIKKRSYINYINTQKGYGTAQKIAAIRSKGSNFSSRCYSNIKDVNKIRSYVYPLGRTKKHYIYSFNRKEKSNHLEFCSQSGNIIQDINIPRSWRQKETIFADMNNDRLPDLVRLTQNQRLDYLINTSENGVISFDQNIQTKKIRWRRKFLSYWIKDLNGDGVNDVVVKSETGLDVFYGKADGGFLRGFERWKFYSTIRSIRRGEFISTLKDRSFLFIDINKDSLPDIISTKPGKIEFFLNTGKSFIAYRPKVFQLKMRELLTVRSADILGHGVPQIALLAKKRNQLSIRYLDYDRPGLGMLKEINDGKGNIVNYEYSLSPVQNGIPFRKIVVSGLMRKSLGSGTSKLKYNYAGAVLDPGLSIFGGYQKVTLNKNTGSIIKGYKYYQGIGQLISEKTINSLNPGVISQTNIVYEEVEALDSPLGIYSIRENLSESGYLGVDDKKIRINNEFDAKNCPTRKTDQTKDHHVTINYSYVDPSKLASHIICLISEVKIRDTKTDKSYQINLEYDELGRKKSISLKGSRGLTVLQKISYKNGRVSVVKNAHGGHEKFIYDNLYRFSKSIHADGSDTTINKWHQSDQAEETIKNHGVGEYQISSRYDEYDRLNKTWDNLGLYTEDQPKEKIAYSYADRETNIPGRIDVKSFLEKDGVLIPQQKSIIQNAIGEVLARIIPTKKGSMIDGLTSFDYSKSLNKSYKSSFAEILDLSNLTLNKLYKDKVIVKTIQKGISNEIYQTQEKLHADIEKQVSTFKVVNNGKLYKIVALSCNNNEDCLARPHKRLLLNADGKVTEITNEIGDVTLFEYDGFNRMTKMSLPSGENQIMIYDDHFSKIKSIQRKNIGTFEFDYYPSGNVKNKKVFDKNKKLLRTILFSYDSSGRVKTKTLKHKSQNKQFIYEYTGSLLTSITTDKYIKRMNYRYDGKMLESKIEVDGIGKIVTMKSYNSQGEVKENHYLGKSNFKGNINTIISYKLNSIGQIDKILLNGKSLINISYDNLNRIKNYQFENTNESLIYDEVSQKNIGFKRGRDLYKFQLNKRGLIKEELYKIGKSDILKSFDYEDRGYLIKSIEKGSLNQTLNYNYNSNGLIKHFDIQAGYSVDIDYTENAWKHGTILYKLDDGGRVKSKEGRVFKYGLNGRIASVSLGNKKFMYIYDEKNNPIAKMGNNLKHLYTEDAMLLNGSLYVAIMVGKRIIGHVKDNKFFPQFSDLRNSIVRSGESKANISSPYGVRDKRETAMNFIDYALKGYDPHIGAVRMGRRWYDPEARLFLTPDTYFIENFEKIVKSPVEGNLYSYAGNNPLNFTDPTGDAITNRVNSSATLYKFLNTYKGQKAVKNNFSSLKSQKYRFVKMDGSVMDMRHVSKAFQFTKDLIEIGVNPKFASALIKIGGIAVEVGQFFGAHGKFGSGPGKSAFSKEDIPSNSFGANAALEKSEFMDVFNRKMEYK